MKLYNTPKDLFSPSDYKKYKKLGFPANVEMLNEAIKSLARTDPGYECFVPINYYQSYKPNSPLITTEVIVVSNKGRVMNTTTGQILRTRRIKENGRVSDNFVIKANSGKTHCITLSRLVACCFIPLPSGEYSDSIAMRLNLDDKTFDMNSLKWDVRKTLAKKLSVEDRVLRLTADKHHATKAIVVTVKDHPEFKGLKFYFKTTLEAIQSGCYELHQVDRLEKPFLTRGCELVRVKDKHVPGIMHYNETPALFKERFVNYKNALYPNILGYSFITGVTVRIDTLNKLHTMYPDSSYVYKRLRETKGICVIKKVCFLRMKYDESYEDAKKRLMSTITVNQYH